jgi:hypothetical protein
MALNPMAFGSLMGYKMMTFHNLFFVQKEPNRHGNKLLFVGVIHSLEEPRESQLYSRKHGYRQTEVLFG